MSTRTLRHGLLGVALAGAAVVLPAATATAAGSPINPVAPAFSSSADAAAARAVAGGLLDRYAASKAKAMGGAPAKGSAASRMAAAVPVYELSPAFVRSGTGPVGQARFAVTTYSIGSEKAAITTAPAPDGTWQAVNVASGDTEARMGALAKGSPLLHEPQVDAWYAVRGDRVVALDGDARTAIGGGSVSVAQYASLVHGRYADKMPGSAYDAAGYAGGYATTPPKARTEDSGQVLAAAGLAAVGVLGVAGVARRRRPTGDTV
ncbi:hypothetical protein [Luteipulveratus flavus]|uniref:Gram-positive cocci surface proteins LPxTG domain-containing protein n=1 Tax=Luteipulveratus flavus TaxID=3031728 RepID=A0ABT6CGK9_9MICO|nr:hypothetical protein [Luteipulveratus sp. YIM 133296]MDF8266441.1 hypothetical protein [Luteipulveratus sp. YIM 133296]